MYDLLLKNISRFIELTIEESLYFTSVLTLKKLRKRQFLIKEGEICRYQYFVSRGCLRTFYIDNKGLEHNVQFSIEDWWSGDMHSFITQKPGRFNIMAIEDSEVVCIDKQSQEALYVQVPKFEKFFRHLLQGAFITLQERVLASMSETAEERYIKFRNKYPEMDKRIPKNQVASFLGITPESLSRVRRELSLRK